MNFGIFAAVVQQQQPQGSSSLLPFFINISLIFLIVYFILIRPNRKERERHKEMVASLKKGDQVITSGGIIGSIIHAAEDRLTIKTGEDTRIVVARNRATRLDEGAAPPA